MLRRICSIIFLVGSIAANSLGLPSPTPSPKSAVESMDANELKEAIQLLKNNYIKPEALNEAELSRATLEGLLVRLGRGVILLPDSAETAAPAPLFFGEILEGHVGYLRLGILERANLEGLDKHLQNFVAKKVD